MWRVEIDVDLSNRVIKNLVPIITVDEDIARKVFAMYRDSLRVECVVRLYAPDRMLVDSERIWVTEESHASS